MTGKFITFEGIDGAGKSSHISWFVESLSAQGIRVVSSREPGGTPLGEKLRDVILNDEMEPATEALLAFAARQENLDKKIRPALLDGQWVVCDRFTDSTIAYQGYGRGFSLEKLGVLEKWVQEDLRPTFTIIFDCDPAVAAQRLADSRVADKFERQSLEFFVRVRDGYLARAAHFFERYAIVDSTQPMDKVRADLKAVLDQLLSNNG